MEVCPLRKHRERSRLQRHAEQEEREDNGSNGVVSTGGVEGGQIWDITGK